MATSQKKKFPNGNFLKVKVPKWQLPKRKSSQIGNFLKVKVPKWQLP